jgi:hypothetical protein
MVDRNSLNTALRLEFENIGELVPPEFDEAGDRIAQAPYYEWTRWTTINGTSHVVNEQVYEPGLLENANMRTTYGGNTSSTVRYGQGLLFCSPGPSGDLMTLPQVTWVDYPGIWPVTRQLRSRPRNVRELCWLSLHQN